MVKSMAVEGIDGFVIEVETTVIKGGQQLISIIGLGDQAVKEAGERMQAAIEFCGYEVPKEKVIISLAPGDRRKRGSHYDLPMTIALLIQTEQIMAKNAADYVFIGELSLNGNVRACTGILPMVNAAKSHRIKSAIVPFDNLEEARSVSGINVVGVENLRDTIRFLEGKVKAADLNLKEDNNFYDGQQNLSNQLSESNSSIDFSDVKGQEDLIDAIALGAAGGHCNKKWEDPVKRTMMNLSSSISFWKQLMMSMIPLMRLRQLRTASISRRYLRDLKKSSSVIRS